MKQTIKYRKHNARGTGRFDCGKLYLKKIEAESYEEAVQKFQKEYGIGQYDIQHPDMEKTEYFVGNLVDYDVQSMQERMEKYQIHFRIGDLAYDRNGKQLSDRYHPIFIHSDDMQKYDQMMRNNP